MNKTLLVLLLICVAYSTAAVSTFYSATAIVKYGTGDARKASVKVDVSGSRQQIDFDFGVTELELYGTKSRYEICSSQCSNYFMPYPFPNYNYRTSGSDGGTINGVGTTKYSYSANGYSTTIWVDNVIPDRIHRVYQTGQALTRTITFTTFVAGSTGGSFVTPPASCQSVQCALALDLIFVIDSSGSISDPDHAIELDFVQNVTDSFQVSSLGVHIGLITFASSANKEIGLSSSPSAVANAIANAKKQQGGNTNIGDAIYAASNEFDLNKRSNVPQVIILLTDGKANLPAPEGTATQWMVTQANNAKNKGSIIYAISVGSVPLTYFNDVSSGPAYSVKVDNFNQLQTTINGIVQQVCIGGSNTDSCTSACKDQQFCGCGQCKCATDASYCGGRGTFSSSTCACSGCINLFQNKAGVDDCSYCDASLCGAYGTMDPNTCICTCRAGYGGARCNECSLNCNANQVQDLCNGCVCFQGTGWTGNDCNVCSSSFCNGNHGVANAQCNACQCNSPWTGSRCETCGFNCNNHGNALPTCNGCNCNNYWTGTNCQTCSLNCQNGGTLPAGTCSSCSCTNTNTFWGGPECDDCNASCKNGGTETTDGTCRCSCVGGWTGKDCSTCNLNCNGRGTRNPTCTACNCNPNIGGPACTTCLLDEKVYCNNRGTLTLTECAKATPTCACTAPFAGTTCTNCVSNLCNNRGTPVPGSECTRCTCNNKWSGDKCQSCDYDCAHGTIDQGNCNTCVCSGFWNTDSSTGKCTVCDSSLKASQCNNHGKITNNCTTCECEYPWTGRTCDTCQFPCQNGGTPTLDGQCNKCTCTGPWTGTDCSVCSDNKLCNNHGTAVDSATCNSCNCVAPWTGNNCQTCSYNCNNHGTPVLDGQCNKCSCAGAFLASSDCAQCDASPLAPFCNNRGNISNPESGCNKCTCSVNQWSGDTCSQCNINCNGHGKPNADCSGCVCDGEYDTATNCGTCKLTTGNLCANEGTPNTACTQCECVGGYTPASRCATCDQSYHDKCVHAEPSLDDCQCVCTDKWTGALCNTCPLSEEEGDCNYPNNGAPINEVINGEPQCRCKCAGFWDGADCDICTLKEGTATCPDISEPVFGDCTCHCPDYYRDIEGCDECIITNDDCYNHYVPGSFPNRTKGVCACECDGNWSGRNCSLCEIDCLKLNGPGYRLNNETCQCEHICGDEIITVEEDCEQLLITDETDRACCTDCKFNTAFCDDANPCTVDDLCQRGDCLGIAELDYSVDQDRNPLTPGPLSTSPWSRWGYRINSVGVSVRLENTKAPTDPNFRYPNSNRYGGDLEFGNIIVANSIAPSAHQFCFTMDSPKRIDNILILGNSRAPTSSLPMTVQFTCANTISATTITARNYGVGSVQQISNPCQGSLVSRICYNNFAGAGIGPLYFCGSPISQELTCVGDYVWHDFTIDNKQDAFEIGIPAVDVQLRSGTTIIDRTTTNSTGGYLFQNLYPDTYTVEFRGPAGYRFSNPNVKLFSPSVLYQGYIDNIVLTANQCNLEIDVGLFLWGSIGDYIWYDFNENGVQDDNRPVANVTLQLFFANNLNNPIGTQVTDAAGKYLFSPLPVYKDAFTFQTYVVKMTPPAGSTVTNRYQGSDRAVDANFEPQTLFSDIITLTATQPNDVTIDGGIYYCCGSVGDYVWIDSDKNGIQAVNETGVPNVTVRLFRDGASIGTTTTNGTGYYLFDNLHLYGTFTVHFDRPAGYVFTKYQQGANRNVDSNPRANGDTDGFFLTREVPHRRDIDAGLVAGCEVADECTTSNDLCVSATCVNKRCVYQNKVVCSAPDNVCVESFCEASTGLCKPSAKTGTVSCDDANECTTKDTCVGGKCTGTPRVNATCTATTGCNTRGTCDATGKCIPNPCTPSTNPCFVNQCVGNTCRQVPVPGNLCNDNNLCTKNDVCQADGSCAGTAVTCENNQQCRTFQCNPLNGTCTSTVLTGLTCDDGVACTVNDRCKPDGTCAGTTLDCSSGNQCLPRVCSFGVCVDGVRPSTCNDNNLCTENDRCDPSGNCVGTPKNCDDNNPCTRDSCVNGVCVNTPDNTATCSDNNKCTTDDRCVNAQCVSTPVVCNDNNVCTTDRCDITTGTCVFSNNTNACDDGNACTTTDICTNGECRGAPVRCVADNICQTATCNALTGQCQITNNTNPCDDGNACTKTDICTGGVCVGYDALQCTDDSVCRTHTCDTTTGSCTYVNSPNGTFCTNAADACFPTGTCLSGECQTVPKVCNDNNDCTNDSCSFGQCIFTLNGGTECDDGNACTINEKCVSQNGVASCVGEPVECDDKNECTRDYCGADGNCVFENIPNQLCDDSSVCTVNDVCVAGECVGTPRDCSVADVCLTGICVEGVGCETEPNANPCSDNDACTPNDVCAGGVCVPGSRIVCPANPDACHEYNCEDGVCILSVTNENGSCDDGKACTENDVCVAGVCEGTPKVCTGTNTCLNYACDSATGECVSTPNRNTCDDGNYCTLTSACVEGVCVGGQNRTCDQPNNVCQRAVCDAEQSKCVVENVSGPCSDNDACTKNDFCANGECQPGTFDSECAPECLVSGDCSAGPCQDVVCSNAGECVRTTRVCDATNDPCTAAVCNPSTDKCEVVPTNNVCDDNNACTQTDVCVNGKCEGSNSVVCEERICEVGVCNAATGRCGYEPLASNTPCDDGNACTTGDVCDGRGSCSGTRKLCNDANRCTDDECVNGECVHTNNDDRCDDANPCTINDVCGGGVCAGTLLECPESDDVCSEIVCSGGKCVRSPLDAESCDDGNDCTTGDVCISGRCEGTPIICSSTGGDACATEGCVGGKCVRITDGARCDDGNPCTDNDVCTGGKCVGTTKDCSAFDSICSAGVCANGQCRASYDDFTTCDDGDVCTTTGTCTEGVCVTRPRVCDQDANPCTTNVCVSGLGCVQTNTTNSCQGNNKCSNYLCLNAECAEFPKPNTCNDNNPCTDDLCDPATGGCVFPPNASNKCSDNNPCTVDQCSPTGECVSTTVNCEDDNPCTDNYCENGACFSVFNVKDCKLDANCVTSAVCISGQCVPNTYTQCQQTTDVCKETVCDKSTGQCADIPRVSTTPVPCDDGNSCTKDDVCQGGVCKGTTPVVCPETINQCTTNVCDPIRGCVEVPTDMIQCTTNNVCSTGICKSGECQVTQRDCSDNDLCTYDSRCGQNGCEHTPYSCILSPCVYHACDGEGYCSVSNATKRFNPHTYYALDTQDGKHILVAVNSTRSIVGTIEFNYPIISLEVQPYSGVLYALGGPTGRDVMRINRATKSGFFNKEKPFDIYSQLTSLNNVDLDFRPVFAAVNKPYTYSQYGLDRTTGDIYELAPGSIKKLTDQLLPSRLFMAISWDNHGRFLYGVQGKDVIAVTPATKVGVRVCSSTVVVPSGELIDLATRFDESLVSVTQDGDKVNQLTFKVSANNTGSCTVSRVTYPVASLYTATEGKLFTRTRVTAVAFDDTICAAVIIPPSSDGGAPPPTENRPPPPEQNPPPPPPPPNAPPPPGQPPGSGPPGGNGDNPKFPGKDTNYVLTGVNGNISTVVVGGVGAASVAMFALFAVVIGFNNTKKKPAVPLDAMLQTTEANACTAENPLFSPMADAANNVVYQ